MNFKRFLKNSHGNVAMLLSISVVPLFVGAGVAIDMSRLNAANTTLQAAVDSAALAAVVGKKNQITDENLSILVSNFLAQNKADATIVGVKVTDAVLDASTNIYRVKVTGKMKTVMMGIIGYDAMDIGAYAEVDGGIPTTLELAMVLDVTDSMNAEGRLPALKIAAKDLVSKVLSNKPATADLKIGIVPFANYVNVGTNNDGQSWLDVPPRPRTWACWNTYPNVTYSNCRQVPNGPIDGVPQVGTHQECDTNYGAPVQQCNWSQSQWYGVVGSRTGLDGQIYQNDASYGGILNYWGPQAITDLTSDKNLLDTNIEALTAAEQTYIPAGLMWGWEVLSAGKPFAVAKAAAEMQTAKGVKVMVLMTDGDNTKSADGFYHWGSNAAAADAKTAELCQSIKNSGITIYTVAFKVQKASSISMLSNCATTPDKAYDAADDVALKIAFGAIAESLSPLRLVK